MMNLVVGWYLGSGIGVLLVLLFKNYRVIVDAVKQGASKKPGVFHWIRASILIVFLLLAVLLAWPIFVHELFRKGGRDCQE